MNKNVVSGIILALLVAAAFLAGSLAHMAGTAPHSGQALGPAETRMLAQVLVHPFPDGGYNVVSTETITVPLWARDPGLPYDRQPAVIAAFQAKGADAAALVERLYQLNAQSAQIALASAPQDGYIVDDGSYAAYFQAGGGGWQRLQQEHPQAANLVRLARPVYDEASGLFLLYLRSDTLGGGRGVFLLYRNEHGVLKLVDMENLWVS